MSLADNLDRLGDALAGTARAVQELFTQQHPIIIYGGGALVLLTIVAWMLTAKNVPRWIGRVRDPSIRAEMSFFEHLDELRSVVLTCLAALLILTIAAWFVTAPVMNFLVRDVAGLERVVFLRPMEAFTARLMVAFMLAFTIGLPFTALQVWSFIIPGLLQREKRLVLPLVFWSTLLFLLGAAFATFGLSPTMLMILRSFGTELVQESLAIRYLLDFFIKMALACGVLFQLPLVVAVLSFVGIVSPEFLKSKWRHAIVMILIVAAIVTPGDGPSQLVLALPIILLYFVSIFISMAIYRARHRPDDEQEPPGGGAPPDDEQEPPGGGAPPDDEQEPPGGGAPPDDEQPPPVGGGPERGPEEAPTPEPEPARPEAPEPADPTARSLDPPDDWVI